MKINREKIKNYFFGLFFSLIATVILDAYGGIVLDATANKFVMFPILAFIMWTVVFFTGSIMFIFLEASGAFWFIMAICIGTILNVIVKYLLSNVAFAESDGWSFMVVVVYLVIYYFIKVKEDH